MRIPAPTVADLEAAPVGSWIFDHGSLRRTMPGRFYKSTDGWRYRIEGWPLWGIRSFTSEHIARVAVTLYTPAPIKVARFSVSLWSWTCRTCGDWDIYDSAAGAHEDGRKHTAAHVKAARA